MQRSPALAAGQRLIGLAGTGPGAGFIQGHHGVEGGVETCNPFEEVFEDLGGGQLAVADVRGNVKGASVMQGSQLSSACCPAWYST